jgi:hypothetical protein
LSVAVTTLLQGRDALGHCAELQQSGARRAGAAAHGYATVHDGTRGAGGAVGGR